MIRTAEPDDDMSRAAQLVREAERIVVFTGAGISAESGIATFRDANGFWTRFPPEQFANWKGLLETAVLEPKRLAEFLVAVLEPIALAHPNAGHRAIAEIQSHKPVTVVTQNIDSLHQDAGSRSVLEVHGSLFEIVHLLSPEKVTRLTRQDLLDIVSKIRTAGTAVWTTPPLLQAISPMLGVGLNGTRRPNLVLFGDAMAEPAWTSSRVATRECDLLISVGTSLSAYPAASLLDEARDAGARVITVDPSTGLGDVWLRGPAADILPRLIGEAFDHSRTGPESDG